MYKIKVLECCGNASLPDRPLNAAIPQVSRALRAQSDSTDWTHARPAEALSDGDSSNKKADKTLLTHQNTKASALAIDPPITEQSV